VTVRILVGDALKQLRTLPSESVHCVVTSPPYWGLRDYGVEGQLGLEKDPRDYIAALVAVFAQVRRVLRRDGTLWLNMGDSYVDGGRGGDSGSTTLLGGRRNQEESRKAVNRSGVRPFGLGAKQLVGMPWRLAIALQDHGWILRSDIIWSKPNPMPESVADRPTKAHEYLFLFARSRRYFYDAGAIMEPVSGTAHARGSGVGPKAKVPAGWATGTGRAHDELAGRYSPQKPHSRLRAKRSKQNESFSSAVRELVVKKNRRSVWSILPRAFREAHFATFPPRLAELCILAGTSPRCCELCGAPWRPLYSDAIAADGLGSGNKIRSYRQDRGGPRDTGRRQAHGVPWQPTVSEIIDWCSTCSCSLATGGGRCVVLDPFAGAGTTGLVAEQLGRDSILIELSATYAAMADARIRDAIAEASA
jgi:DNA modification methylase